MNSEKTTLDEKQGTQKSFVGYAIMLFDCIHVQKLNQTFEGKKNHIKIVFFSFFFLFFRMLES